ncbi:hypothetical protein G6M50_36740 [Agrobacterium rhizogenes]|nr:hypothetical protein [Rhizobium rhizogenes]NTJ83335.1 hypothetical protein [Rhizobium rhizogenes]
MARIFTHAAEKARQAKRNGFVGFLLIILINDLMAAAAAVYVFYLRG